MNSIDLYCSAPQLNIFDYSLSRLIELDRDIRQRNLKVMAMTPENCVYPVNFCTQDPVTRQSSIRYYQRAIDTAEFLGCPNIQISTGFGYFDQPREEAWKILPGVAGTAGRVLSEETGPAFPGGAEGHHHQCPDYKQRHSRDAG